MPHGSREIKRQTVFCPTSSVAHSRESLRTTAYRPPRHEAHGHRDQRWIPLVGCPRQRGDAADLQRRAICGSMSAASAHSEESDTPMRRMPFRGGNLAASNCALIDAKAERSKIGVRRDRLRVMIRKSANFTLSVTVRPLTPVVHACAGLAVHRPWPLRYWSAISTEDRTISPELQNLPISAWSLSWFLDQMLGPLILYRTLAKSSHQCRRRSAAIRPSSLLMQPAVPTPPPDADRRPRSPSRSFRSFRPACHP